MMKDNFGREINYLRVSLTDRCNYRCSYCMPPCGIEKKSHNDILSLEDIFTIISTFAKLGGNKVRFTGGEPLVRIGAASLIERVSSELPEIKKLCLTTNGILLPQYFDQLKRCNLSSINISIDSLDEKKYTSITGGGNLENALNGLQLAKQLAPEVKVNAVLMRGINDTEILSFAKFARDNDVKIRFIELMPFAANSTFSKYNILADEVIQNNNLTFVERINNTDYYAFDSDLKVGFIRPLSHKFCGDCNRLRLTSDGKIMPCLHNNIEVDIKPYLLNGNVEEAIINSVNIKPKAHAINLGNLQKRNMNTIGG